MKTLTFHITTNQGCWEERVVDPPRSFHWHIDTEMNCLVLRYTPDFRDLIPLHNVQRIRFTVEST